MIYLHLSLALQNHRGINFQHSAFVISGKCYPLVKCWASICGMSFAVYKNTKFSTYCLNLHKQIYLQKVTFVGQHSKRIYSSVLFAPIEHSLSSPALLQYIYSFHKIFKKNTQTI